MRIVGFLFSVRELGQTSSTERQLQHHLFGTNDVLRYLLVNWARLSLIAAVLSSDGMAPRSFGQESKAAGAGIGSLTQASTFSFPLANREKIVWIGGGFVEREGQLGIIETKLRLAFPKKQLAIRYLGWTGDTVWAESRGIFDAPEVGYQRLIALVNEIAPSRLVLAYGQNEAYAGEAGLDRFIAQYRKLYTDLSAGVRRFVFVTPHLMEPGEVGPRRHTRTAIHNAEIKRYATAIVALANELKEPVVDLTKLGTLPTTNGLSLSDLGYSQVGEYLVELAGGPKVKITAETYERLLKGVQRKNELFFHRWRPQNITYLTGFRAHEQGNNAVEIKQFDPLVEAAEADLAKLLN
jgi:hypothetical protein